MELHPGVSERIDVHGIVVSISSRYQNVKLQSWSKNVVRPYIRIYDGEKGLNYLWPAWSTDRLIKLGDELKFRATHTFTQAYDVGKDSEMVVHWVKNPRAFSIIKRASDRIQETLRRGDPELIKQELELCKMILQVERHERERSQEYADLHLRAWKQLVH